MRMARVGILFDRQAANKEWSNGRNAFGRYLGEILAQRGIPYHWVDDPAQLNETDADIILIGCMEEGTDASQRLLAYMERGGSVVSFAGVNDLADRFGCRAHDAIGAGYAFFENAADYGETGPLRFLRAVPWSAVSEPSRQMGWTSAGTITRETPDRTAAVASALLRFAVGNGGTLDRFALDLPATVVMLQQGTGPVLEDGAPAPDGTAGIDDGVLKADDVTGLHWMYDRATTPTGLPYFAYPYADWWRERLAGHLVRLAVDKGLSLPFVAYWPEGVEQVALISHDSDGNVDEHAVSTLDVLADLQIRSTWCMLEPGYSADIYDRVRREGHELAFHYNAVEADDGFWAEEEFHRQFGWLKQAVAPTSIVSNKNHLTRVEGWGDLFRWCEAAGIASDQTRGPSKKGNVGFIYGTCHPYFPAAWADEQNRIYPVLEIGFLSPDIDHGKWSDSGLIAPLLQQVKQVGGVLHMIFHQVHIHSRERVRQALYEVIRQARALNYSFWTGRMIVEWTQQRRSLTIQEVDRQGIPTVWDVGQTAAEGPAGQAVVWVPVPAEVRSELDPSVEYSFYYGIACRKYVTPNRK